MEVRKGVSARLRALIFGLLRVDVEQRLTVDDAYEEAQALTKSWQQQQQQQQSAATSDEPAIAASMQPPLQPPLPRHVVGADAERGEVDRGAERTVTAGSPYAV